MTLLAVSESDAHRAAVERAEKGDHLLPLRVIAGQFESRLDRFGPRIGEEDLLRELTRRDLRQLFGQLELAAIIEVGPRHVQQVRRLPMDRLDDPRMAMARRADGDARVKVEEPVAVDVLDDGPLGPRHDQRVNACVRRRRHPFIRAQALPRLGPGSSVRIQGTANSRLTSSMETPQAQERRNGQKGTVKVQS